MSRVREPFAGPDDGPIAPFPIKLNGEVVKGFGRGSKEVKLGIPTANLPIDGLSVGGHKDIDSGVYFGWAALNISSQGSNISASTASSDSAMGNIFPAVLSIGYNPFYKNTVRSVEVHIMHNFPADFYGAHMNLVILGFIRPEYDYVSKESLIEDIKEDMEVATRSLARGPYQRSKEDGYLLHYDPSIQQSK